jgi:hypothetical protein
LAGAALACAVLLAENGALMFSSIDDVTQDFLSKKKDHLGVKR